MDRTVVAVNPRHLEGTGVGVSREKEARAEQASVRGDGVVVMAVGVVGPLDALAC